MDENEIDFINELLKRLHYKNLDKNIYYTHSVHQEYAISPALFDIYM